MTSEYIMKGDRIEAGPFTDAADRWSAQKAVLDECDPDEWSSVRPVKVWAVTDHYDDGTIYFTNIAKNVTAFFENGRDGWNAGLFDDTKEVPPTIEGTQLYDVPKPVAMCHLFALIQHIDEYAPATEGVVTNGGREVSE